MRLFITWQNYETNLQMFAKHAEEECPLIYEPEPIVKTKTLLNCEKNSKPKFVLKNANCAFLLHAPTHTFFQPVHINAYK